MEYPELKGYLRKKSRQGRWQRRYFEATTHYLTYYKNRESEKLLACIDLWKTQDIEFNLQDPDKLEFSIAIGDQSYLLKADSQDDAQRWIKGLKLRQHRPEGTPSEVFSLRSERQDAESDASSDHTSRRSGQYASSDTGSVGNASKQRRMSHTKYTDSTLNPIIPNADAIAAANTKYPMLKTNQSIRSTATTERSSKPEDENVNAACCAPCKTM